MKKILLIAVAMLCLTNLKFYAQDTTNLDPYQYFSAYVGNRWVYEGYSPLGSWTVVKDSIDLQDSSRFVLILTPYLFWCIL